MTPGEHANAIAGACGKLFGIELPVSVHAHIADAIRAAEAAAFARGRAAGLAEAFPTVIAKLESRTEDARRCCTDCQNTNERAIEYLKAHTIEALAAPDVSPAPEGK